jgi:hypothetical protein
MSRVSNMLLEADEDFQDANRQSCSVLPLMTDRGSPLDGSCQEILRKAWPLTIVGTIFGVDHAPATLKTSFVDFEKG